MPTSIRPYGPIDGWMPDSSREVIHSQSMGLPTQVSRLTISMSATIPTRVEREARAVRSIYETVSEYSYVCEASMTTRLTRAEQQARTRSTLLEAAERVIVERGYQGASVEAITAAAGYTRGAFYSNFASKEELFAELLQERTYERYRDMAARAADREQRSSPREVGEELAAIQADDDTHWLFRLWLELLAHAGRDEQFRKLAAEFWRGTREATARALEAQYAEA